MADQPPAPVPPKPPGPVAVAAAWLLVVLGVLWTGLTGLCTLSVATVGGWNGRDLMSALPVALAFGLPSMIPGALMLWGGIAMLRAQRKARDS